MNDDKLLPLENYHVKIFFLIQLKEKKEEEKSRMILIVMP